MTTHHHPTTDETPWHAVPLVGQRFTYADMANPPATAEVVDVFADRFGTWATLQWEDTRRDGAYAAHALLAVLNGGPTAGTSWKVATR